MRELCSLDVVENRSECLILLGIYNVLVTERELAKKRCLLNEDIDRVFFVLSRYLLGFEHMPTFALDQTDELYTVFTLMTFPSPLGSTSGPTSHASPANRSRKSDSNCME